MKLRRDLLITLVVALAACSAAASGAPETSAPPASDVATAPESDPGTEARVATTHRSTTSVLRSTTSSTTTLPAETTTTTTLVGQAAFSNRILIIGDSVLASTAQRYGGDMCAALVPLGWKVELDAESGRFIEFGQLVLKKRLDAGWDVVAIMLGNNFNGNVDNYRTRLGQMVDQLSPRPVVLFTVTEFRPVQAFVNAVIREVAASHPNVAIVDWAARSENAPELLGGDGLHLSDAGRVELSAQAAAALGAAPVGPGQCMRTSYSDDSAGPVVGTTVRPTQTTVRRVTPTTVRPSPGTTFPPTATTSKPPSSTQPEPTSPPKTDPPPTRPPATQPPATQPPATQPPVTTAPSGSP